MMFDPMGSASSLGNISDLPLVSERRLRLKINKSSVSYLTEYKNAEIKSKTQLLEKGGYRTASKMK